MGGSQYDGGAEEEGAHRAVELGCVQGGDHGVGLAGGHATHRAGGQGGDHVAGLGGCLDEGRAVDLGGGQDGNQGTGLCSCHGEHRAVDQGSGEDGDHDVCQVGRGNDVHGGHCDEDVDAGFVHLG